MLQAQLVLALIRIWLYTRVWDVELHGEVDKWLLGLAETDPETADHVRGAIDHLATVGPRLGRPLVDRIHGSRYHNMKELRPGSAGATEVRILFVFDSRRAAILLVAGDKSGDWNRWYEFHIPLADRRYQEHLETLKGGSGR